MGKKKSSVIVTSPFFEHLRLFYKANRGQILFSYKDITKRLLDYNNPENATAFLRRPQYEAFEMYVFLKEYLGNPQLAELLDDWRHQRGKFGGGLNTSRTGQANLFWDTDLASYEDVFQNLLKVKQAYANYIFALTMGVGKTILMATCIFYEFLLAKKFPKDPRFCHNVLVFAPDTTVLFSLKEIQEFDKRKVLPQEYAQSLESEIKFHFLEESGITLNTLDRSSYNIVISNSQKIIRKRQHAQKSAGDRLFAPSNWEADVETDPNSDLYALADEGELSTNQRFQKLSRLHQMGIYVDEAHHAFGKSLQKDMADHQSTTSLRLTIDLLSKELQDAGTHVVACYNFTGTPYVENQLMPEVVYAFSLKDAIAEKYLKTATVTQVSNAKSVEFLRNAIKTFIETHGDKTYEGMRPKMAIFASTIEELTQTLKPEVESVLLELGLSTSSILVNVGDEKLTSADDIKEFRLLDTKESTKQFILLVGKGKEGWNCRSLFSVALYRQPKSKIFVLQATMRCLRSITDIQQEGHVFLSEENFTILKDELESNFRMSVDDFQSKGAEEGKMTVTVRPRKPPVFIEVIEKKTLFQLNEKIPPSGFPLGLADLDPENYKITAKDYRLQHLDRDKTEQKDITTLRSDQEFSSIMLVAEIARYLNRSPLSVKAVLEQTEEGLDGILKWVNKANRILYEVVIPKLFKNLYEIEEYQSKGTVTKKLLVKTPPDGQDGYQIRVKEDLFVQECDDTYKSNSSKSFHLDGYGFDSVPEKEFFVKNLPNDKIKNIWFTGMLTHGQTEFIVHYIDPESHALRSYYPDFLLEMTDGQFFIVEVKGDNMLLDPVILAKQDYAQKMAVNSNMKYLMIPGTKAGQRIQDFLSDYKLEGI